MRVSIVPADNRVTIDGVSYLVDLSELRAQNIQAVQWYDDWGEVEYKSVWVADEHRHHAEPNQHITDLSPYQKYIDEWYACQQRDEANKELMEAEMQKLLDEQNKTIGQSPS